MVDVYNLLCYWCIWALAVLRHVLSRFLLRADVGVGHLMCVHETGALDLLTIVASIVAQCALLGVKAALM